MIDFGLLVSMIVGFGTPALLAYWWPLSSCEERVGFLDVAIGPAFAGLAVGRLTALALDDPSSIGSISDMLIIRSGVEFWPGVATAAAVLVVGARRANVSLLDRVADLAPLSMVGYAAYEAACVFRDGCFGPRSAIGLRPPGVDTTMLPIGWFIAVAVAVGAVGVRQLVRAGTTPVIVVTIAAATVAGVRAVASIWLPHVSEGLTRQHITSIGVGAGAAALLAGLFVVSGRGRAAAGPAETGRSAANELTPGE